MSLPINQEERLAEIAALPANWNSYGAERITPFALEEARRLLAQIPEGELPACAVLPRANGGIDLDWPGYRISIGIPAERGSPYEVAAELSEVADGAALLRILQQ